MENTVFYSCVNFGTIYIPLSTPVCVFDEEKSQSEVPQLDPVSKVEDGNEVPKMSKTQTKEWRKVRNEKEGKDLGFTT